MSSMLFFDSEDEEDQPDVFELDNEIEFELLPSSAIELRRDSELNRKDLSYLKKLFKSTANLLIILREDDFTSALKLINKLCALKTRKSLVGEQMFVFNYMVPMLHLFRSFQEFAKKTDLKKLPQRQSKAFWKVRKKFPAIPFWNDINDLSNTKTRTSLAIRHYLKQDVNDIVLDFHDCVSYGCSNAQFLYQSLEIDKFIKKKVLSLNSRPPNLGHGDVPNAQTIRGLLAHEEYLTRGFR